MNNEKFLVQAGLYDKVKITSDDFDDLINLLSGKQKIDLYCSKCKEKRTFCAKSKTVKLQKRKLLCVLMCLILLVIKKKKTHLKKV